MSLQVGQLVWNPSPLSCLECDGGDSVISVIWVSPHLVHTASCLETVSSSYQVHTGSFFMLSGWSSDAWRITSFMEKSTDLFSRYMVVSTLNFSGDRTPMDMLPDFQI